MTASLVVFGLCVAALVITAWLARREDSEATVAELFDRLMTSRTVRVAVVVCWWGLGWHLLVGQTGDPGFVAA